MSNILLLGLQQVIAGVQADEDFAPPSLLFLESDGVTLIDLTGIEFTAQIGNFPPLTSANDAITVSGNALTFFVPAAQKNWAPGRYSFSLTATDGLNTRDIFANSTFTVGQPASFSMARYGGASNSTALSSLSGATLLALVSSLTEAQQQDLAVILTDAGASYAPDFDFSHVMNSQYLPVLPFLTNLG